MKTKDIRIAKDGLSDNIYAGKLSKDGTEWLDKKDVTNDFLAAVIARWSGYTQTISGSDGSRYELSLKKKLSGLCVGPKETAPSNKATVERLRSGFQEIRDTMPITCDGSPQGDYACDIHQRIAIEMLKLTP